MNSQKNQSIFETIEGDRFQFSCDRNIPCFNKCCARLRLILTPYDILRMKNRLKLLSNEFLDKHTETIIENSFRFPMVKLKMGTDENQICPFVTEKGCAIYEDRPAACRLYPIGRASTIVDGEKNSREKFFIVRESHCLGFQEKKSWTIGEWLEHEGVNEYNAMNDPWLGIITSSKSLGGEEATKKFQVFFLASYNLDKFRQFIFESRFFDLFEVNSELKENLEGDDTALMKFGFNWLKYSLFGDQTMQPKSHSVTK